MKKVSIVDYGIGNILSVQRAFEYCGVTTELISVPEQIFSADYLVLPGVGAFRNGMERLKEKNLEDALVEYCKSNRPFMGICLGMQMMMEESEEFGITQGLGIIKGTVKQISNISSDGSEMKIPHIGWNHLYRDDTEASECLLCNIKPEETVYFVHSFAAFPEEKASKVAYTVYGGNSITAIIKRGNSYGVQFHPEKSGKTGLKILHNFLEC